MIEAQLLRDQGILVVTPVQKLEKVDFERLRTLADPWIEEHGSLNGLLIDADDFSGWEDFAGMLAHFRFVHDYHDKLERVAAVTDSGFLAILPKVAGHFVAAEVRHFKHEERDKALGWLRTGVKLP